jgi:hypothetical protein
MNSFDRYRTQAAENFCVAWEAMVINSIDSGTISRLVQVNNKKDEIFFGHEACRRNLAALLFGPCGQ